MPNILLVCTANICRSPVAEVLLRDRLQKRGLSGWKVSSAGTWAEVIRGASRYSIHIMAEAGFDIKSHQSRMIEEQHLLEADLVLCMEAGHVEALQTEFPTYARKIHLMSEMVGKRYSISDPYGQEIGAYRLMFSELKGIIDAGLDKIIRLAEENGASEYQ